MSTLPVFPSVPLKKNRPPKTPQRPTRRGAPPSTPTVPRHDRNYQKGFEQGMRLYQTDDSVVAKAKKFDRLKHLILMQDKATNDAGRWEKEILRIARDGAAESSDSDDDQRKL